MNFGADEQEYNGDTPDVAPPIAIQTLTLLWMGLFGGRWIGVTLLQWTGCLSPDDVTRFDSGILTRCYLVLLVLTILVVVLRGARRISTAAPNAGTAADTAESGRISPAVPVSPPRREHRKRD